MEFIGYAGQTLKVAKEPVEGVKGIFEKYAHNVRQQIFRIKWSAADTASFPGHLP
jgi:hypothetical protein